MCLEQQVLIIQDLPFRAFESPTGERAVVVNLAAS